MSAQPKTTEGGFFGRCWCSGRRKVWFSMDYLDRRCGGSMILRCLCGGDFCVCHNHGEAECFGCPDCERDSDDRDLYDDEDADLYC